MKLYVKYMVSQRCKMIVTAELEKLGLHAIVVHLGEIEIKETLSNEQRERLKNALSSVGLELVEDQKTILIEKIKAIVIELVHYSDEMPLVNYSDYISEKLNYHYTYLSNLFSETMGFTLHQFIVFHKIERIKELIIYGELALSQIAWKLNYSSPAHLCNQFKKVTGYSPSQFKQLKEKRRKPLEEI